MEIRVKQILPHQLKQGPGEQAEPGRRCYQAGGAYLLATVLENFFGLYAAINTFTRLKARLSGRSGVLASWPPRTGEKTLL